MHVWAHRVAPDPQNKIKKALLKNDAISCSNINTCAITSLTVFPRDELLQKLF